MTYDEILTGIATLARACEDNAIDDTTAEQCHDWRVAAAHLRVSAYHVEHARELDAVPSPEPS
jgi:hypothetical protein